MGFVSTVNPDSSQHWLTAVLNESYEGKWNDADVETRQITRAVLHRKILCRFLYC